MFWILRRIALIEDRLIRSEAQVLKLSPGWHTVRINIRYEKANQVNTTLEWLICPVKASSLSGCAKDKKVIWENYEAWIPCVMGVPML